MKRKRNPFTTDEAQTATLLVAEGYPYCHRVRHRKTERFYPGIGISMCDKEALEPASRVFNVAIVAERRREIYCPPHLFPLEGKGIWRVRTEGTRAERIVQHLDPLLTTEFKTKWKRIKEKCPPK